MVKRKKRVVDTGSWKDDYPGLNFNPYVLPKYGTYLDGDGRDLRELFDEMGLVAWDEIFSPLDIWRSPGKRDPKKNRVDGSKKVQDVIFRAWDMGVLDFSTFYMDAKGKWHMYVEETDLVKRASRI